MSGTTVAIVGFLAMLVMIGLRAPIGLAMLVVGGVGYGVLSSPTALFGYMKSNAYHQFANYTLSVVPLFILMGALAERAGIAASLFKAAERVVGRARGGLAMAVIGACTAFGAICGSSVATTATFGRAALPELLKYRYNGGFSTGTIAVGGTLGILIPPSVILVVYAIQTEQNIKKLFQAAVIPGLLAALFYCLTIAYVVWRKPELAPKSDIKIEPVPQNAVLKLCARVIGFGLLAIGIGLVAVGRIEYADALIIGLAGLLIAIVDLSVMPAVLVAILVVGGINNGWFTPTEGAAVGAIAMLLIGVVTRKLSSKDIGEAIRQTAETSGMIFIILLGAEVFGAFLSLTRLPTTAAEAIGALGYSPYVVLVAMLAFYILLGAVMDELAMILLTLPVFFPIIEGLDFGFPSDEVAVWFGILVLMVVGIGLTAPPIGLNVFVISAIARGVPIADTYRGVLPFVLADLIRLALVVAFPAICLTLVRLLN